MEKIAITQKRPDDSSGLIPLDQAVGSFHELVDKFFEDPWLKTPSLFKQSLFSKGLAEDWWPKADVSETDKDVKIKINVPGVDPEKINIEADSNALVISGSTEREEEKKGENWYRLERESGEFRRSFELPSGCDVDAIQAVTKNGALQIVIPKKPEAQKKKVSVKIENK